MPIPPISIDEEAVAELALPVVDMTISIEDVGEDAMLISILLSEDDFRGEVVAVLVNVCFRSCKEVVALMQKVKQVLRWDNRAHSSASISSLKMSAICNIERVCGAGQNWRTRWARRANHRDRIILSAATALILQGLVSNPSL